MGVGSWEMEDGRWKMGNGSWELGVGSFRTRMIKILEILKNQWQKLMAMAISKVNGKSQWQKSITKINYNGNGKTSGKHLFLIHSLMHRTLLSAESLRGTKQSLRL
jgi:hypothetical protein